FAKEAEFMQRIGKNLQSIEGVVVPTPQAPYCTRRVLTTTYLEGVKVSALEQLESWDLDRTDLARRFLRAYCKMIFVDGLYHADPHPGNVMVTPDGSLGLLDFGAVAELSPAMREGIPDFLGAVIRRDTAGIHSALRSMGFIAHGAEAAEA